MILHSEAAYTKSGLPLVLLRCFHFRVVAYHQFQSTVIVENAPLASLVRGVDEEEVANGEERETCQKTLSWLLARSMAGIAPCRPAKRQIRSSWTLSETQETQETSPLRHINFNMVLEATMIVVDNSEYMRNGDFLPTRFQAQSDSLLSIFRRKTNSNPENTVGLMSMSGDSVRVLSTLTSDIGKILAGLHEIKIYGKSHLTTGIQVACLALRNRENKTQRQRVVVFVGSPIEESDEELEKLAKRLKKNNVAIDFINFGEEQVNTAKLEKFVSIATRSDGEESHLVTVSPGPTLLYEAVDRSAMFNEEDGGFGSGFGGDDFGFDDPNMDPELALAIRLSLEEETSRQSRQEATAPVQSLEPVQEESASAAPDAENAEEESKPADVEMADADKEQ